MADFSQYGSPSDEWKALEKTLPAPATGQSIDELVKLNNDGREKVSAEEMKELAASLVIEDHQIPARDGFTLEARTYRPAKADKNAKLPLVLHLHGGGHLLGTLSSEDAACARIVIATGACVLNVNYRHTPKYTYPTAWEDAEDAIKWLHKSSSIAFDGTSVILEGISAGAWITASLVLAQRLDARLSDCPPIAGQILVIPCVVHKDYRAKITKRLGNPEGMSWNQNANAAILPNTRIDQFLGLLAVPKSTEDDVFLNPGNATVDQLQGMPPSVFGIAGYDPLRDEGLLYADLLKEAG